MTGSCSIFIGDLARALKKLQPRNEVTQAIAKALGFEIIEKVPQEEFDNLKRGLSKENKESFFKSDKKGKRPNGLDKGPRQPTAPDMEAEEKARQLPELISHRAPSFSQIRPKWLVGVRPLEAENESHVSTSLDLEPLFNVKQTRSIVAFSLSTRSYEGPVDIEAALTCIAKGQPVKKMPRYPVATIRFGAQVLLDKREAMVPFFRDQSKIVNTLERIMGKEGLQIFYFAKSPFRVSPLGTDGEQTDYHVPPPGTPVLLVSDLGIGMPALSFDNPDEGEWLRFANRVRNSGCPVVVFCPYPPSRWPSGLTRVFTIIQWDRTTTAWTVRRTVGLGHLVKI